MTEARRTGDREDIRDLNIEYPVAILSSPCRNQPHAPANDKPKQKRRKPKPQPGDDDPEQVVDMVVWDDGPGPDSHNGA